MKKGYYAIIPANVRYDKSLRPNSKLLYGEITALCNEKGFCWASNSYFAELYEVSKETISRWISELVEKGYIHTELIYKDGTNEIINRYIRISHEPIDEMINTPIDEKVKGNNTVTNNTVNKDHTAKIKDLLPVFSPINNFIELNKRYWDVIRETRKTGRIAESVIYNNMNKWTKYDLSVVEYALKSHIDSHAGKREEYTLGIMRNTKKEDIGKSNNNQPRRVARF